MKPKGLCFRCEWRATALETGSGPRHECHADTTVQKFCCYMYRPCVPVAVRESNPDDPRPLSLNYFSARAEVSPEQPTMRLLAKTPPQGLIVYWEPDDGDTPA